MMFKVDKYFLQEQTENFSLDDLSDLYESTCKNPYESYSKLLLQKSKTPQEPLIDNLLIFSLLRQGRLSEANQAIKRAYLNYPNNLFAKLNYADLCLRTQQADKIPDIFPSLELADLFPNLTIPFSFFVGFTTMASRYFLTKKNFPTSDYYYSLAKKASPFHFSVVLLGKSISRKKKLHTFSQIFKLAFLTRNRL